MSTDRARLAYDMAAAGINDAAFFAADGFAKLFHMPAGRVIGQHAHRIGHAGVLLLGTVRVTDPQTVTEYAAPAVIQLPAHVAHEIESVTAALWACVWPNADGALTETDFENLVIE